MRFFSGDEMGIDSTDVLEAVEADATDWELDPAIAVAAFVWPISSVLLSSSAGIRGSCVAGVIAGYDGG